jgi:hypothetical protein
MSMSIRRVIRAARGPLCCAAALLLVVAYVSLLFGAVGPMWAELEYWLRVYTALPGSRIHLP